MTTESQKKPGLGIATVLAVLGPTGTGHLYLGQTRRALQWLLIPAAGAILFASLIPFLGVSIGYGVMFVLLALLVIGAWVGSIIDLRRIPASTVRAVPVWQVLVFFLGGMLFTSAVRTYLRSAVLEAFKIPSGAMQPALLVGDHIFVDKSLNTRVPKRGIIVVFKYPQNRSQDFVMRIIGLGGDRVEVRRGHPWVNGTEVPHCLVGKTQLPGDEGTPRVSAEVWLETLDGQSYLTMLADDPTVSDYDGPYTVKDGEFFVLGDNRNRTHDSRRWFGGAGGGVPNQDIVGRAMFRWMSEDDVGPSFSRFGRGFEKPLLPASLADLQPGLTKCLNP